jgi:hypothetical protein
VEVVIVALGAEPGRLAPDDGFASVRVVEASSELSLEQARALGVRHAKAPVVFLGETHSFPHPDFAEALMEAHEGPWAAVMPAMENANPKSAISTANLVLDYGAWLSPGPAREVETVTDFNCSFKREALLGITRSLEEVFEDRGSLPGDLLARGHRLYLDPAARLAHLNVATPRAWLVERYLAGRVLGGARAARWPRSRRLLYLIGVAAVPILQLVRGLRVARRLRLPRLRYFTVVPSIFVGSVAWTVGEAFGYVGGTGGAARKMIEYELHKRRHASVKEPYVVPSA